MRMRRSKLAATLVASFTAVTLVAACGGGSEGADVNVDTDATFAAGTTMDTLQKAGKITIGVKVDQPGIGYQKPGADTPEGFDIEMGKIIAAALGIEAGDIEWKETVSKNREPFIQNGTVDIVIASYSITDKRKEVVSFAGPYYVTGQQLLVRADDDSIKGPDDLEGKKVCSVTGSTSIKTVEEKYGAQPAPYSTYSECVQQLDNKVVDAVTTDGAILLGYAAEDPDNRKVVGDAFSEERYGVGLKKGDTQFCQFITDTLKKAQDDGAWEEAFEATLGKSDVETPAPPAMDPCS